MAKIDVSPSGPIFSSADLFPKVGEGVRRLRIFGQTTPMQEVCELLRSGVGKSSHNL
jgi:hypothetical protein